MSYTPNDNILESVTLEYVKDLTEDKINYLLTLDPKYSAIHIDLITAIAESYKSVEAKLLKLGYEDHVTKLASVDLSTYDVSQLSAIKNIFDELITTENADFITAIPELINNELNATQIMVLHKALTNGVPYSKVSKYIDPSIPFSYSNWVLASIADGFPEIEEYLDYNRDQICEIYSGMKDKVDYTVYAKKELSALLMQVARTALNLNLTVTVTEDNKLTIE